MASVEGVAATTQPRGSLPIDREQMAVDHARRGRVRRCVRREVLQPRRARSEGRRAHRVTVGVTSDTDRPAPSDTDRLRPAAPGPR